MFHMPQAPEFIVLILAVFLVLVGLFQILWNTTLPDLFGIKRITLWQAFKIMLLATMLFGGRPMVTYGTSTVAQPPPQAAGNAEASVAAR